MRGLIREYEQLLSNLRKMFHRTAASAGKYLEEDEEWKIVNRAFTQLCAAISTRIKVIEKKYEPRPEEGVDISPIFSIPGPSHPLGPCRISCPLIFNTGGDNWICTAGLGRKSRFDGHIYPGDDCPGEGEYRLARTDI